ncbi:MAG: DUF3526 domain-containing protein [Gammaproteobacteria bacterium AqS3]|nr:DUF3526 domain-containing protein [Gammaproteobacteria bacterium AqS3]
MLSDLGRELRFAWREPVVRWTTLIAFGFTVFALTAGLLEVRNQEREIAGLAAATVEDQKLVLDGQPDPGSAAYYTFHLTYDPPSALAFAALGSRDELSWKHRLRMLAVEGQIYETDTDNSELSLIGQLDFAYLVSILLPLLVIGLLFDLEARERRESRYELVCATSAHGRGIFLVRALARCLILAAAIALPFLGFALYGGVSIGDSLLVLALASGHILFWLLVCRLVTVRNLEGATAALILLSLWFLLSVVVPVVGKTGVERMVAVPDGGHILLTQREKVNDAWDLPKSATMDPFLKTYPELTDYAEIKRQFEWKWYYAFQEMGDQTAAPLSTDLYEGMRARDGAMGWVALLSPPLMTHRVLTQMAQTDVDRHLRYVQCARDFHARLRHFFYPMLFGPKPFSKENMSELPQFEPCIDRES